MKTFRLGAVLLALVASVAFMPSAGAADSGLRLEWCDGSSPHLDVAGLLPGEQRALDLDLCNTGSQEGVLVATATADAQGLVGSLARITFDDGADQLWSGTVNQIDGAVLGSKALAAGSARHLRIVLELPASADNRVAGAHFDFQLLLQLQDPAAGGPGAVGTSPGAVVSVGGETVTASPATPGAGSTVRANPDLRGDLPFTGADLTDTTLLALAAIGVGGLLSTARRRRAGRDV